MLVDVVRVKGRAPKPWHAEVVRELTAEDMPLLMEEKGAKPRPLQRLSQRHHALARNLASGMSRAEAAFLVGYDPHRVSILQNDPTFKELVQFYSEAVNAQYATLHEKLSHMSMEAAEIVHQRMEEEPEKIPTGMLMEIVKTGADRTGFGPQSKSTQVNINVNLADRLEAARKRIADRRKTIEHEP